MTTKNQCFCAAHGCTLLGTMSTSTSGSDEWWCSMHFGKDASQLQPLTVEINRREWLAKAITSIRMQAHGEAWPETFKFVQHEMAMNQRADLKHNGKEAIWQWLVRLEKELESMCRGSFTNPPKQVRMAEEGFKRVQFDAPLPA